MKICFHLNPTPLPFIKASTVNSFVGLLSIFFTLFWNIIFIIKIILIYTDPYILFHWSLGLILDPYHLVWLLQPDDMFGYVIKQILFHLFF